MTELLEATSIDQWRYVKGYMNPASIGIRGMTISGLMESEWFTGPVWLKEEEIEWPARFIAEPLKEESVLVMDTTGESLLE